MIKAVLFDLDGTLYNQSQFLFQGFEMVAKKVEKDFQLKRGQWQRIFEQLKKCYKEGRRVRIFNKALEKTLPKLSKKVLNAYIEREVLLYFKMAPRKLKLYPGVRALLKTIQSKGMRMGLITQGHPINQLNKLFSLGIYDIFDVIEISGFYDTKKAKPNAFLFKKALKELSLSPKEAVYVGDDWDLDQGAVKAGMHFYFLNKNGHQRKRSQTLITPIQSLTEIRKLIA